MKQVWNNYRLKNIEKAKAFGASVKISHSLSCKDLQSTVTSQTQITIELPSFPIFICTQCHILRQLHLYRGSGQHKPVTTISKKAQLAEEEGEVSHVVGSTP